MKYEKSYDFNDMACWSFENGIEVYEKDFDYNLHCFKVWRGDKYLGGIYPNSIEDMEHCIKCLDDGSEPITDSWEDGHGNCCDRNGWGDGL